MGPWPHTKFEHNPPSRLRDLENRCARAHVQMHSTSDTCKALIWWVPSHTPNLNAIGPAVVELPRERVSPTLSPRHVPRAVAGTSGYRYRSNTWLIGWLHRIKMTVRELVIPFQRNKRSKSVTTAGRPAAHTDFSPVYRSRLTAAIAAARNHDSFSFYVFCFPCNRKLILMQQFSYSNKRPIPHSN